MKKIETIVRKSKFEDVRKALRESDIDFFSWWDVKGQGDAKQDLVFRGINFDNSAIDRTFISFVVRDQNLEKAVSAIQKAAYTGESGDGRIFILNIEQSIRIRTGEKGDDSLYNK